MHAKVAIITRTKDRGILLERAIQSIHNQTMKDYIHVIINDAGNPKVVDDLVDKYKSLIAGRVKVIHNKTSHGMEAASNKAIKSVDSTYVAIHDDDDTWHPEFLQRTVGYMEETGAMGVVVITDKIVERITRNNTIKKISQERWLPGVRTISLYKQFLDNYATPITFIYRREVYKKIGYYDETLPVAGDWDFALRFLLQYDIDFLDSKEALAYYHHRPATKGINQNSVFVDNGLKHEQVLNRLTNHYLRTDIARGVVGLGYYISSARVANESSSRLKNAVEERIDRDTVRIEAHMNYVSDRLKLDFDKSIQEHMGMTNKSYAIARKFLRR